MHFYTQVNTFKNAESIIKKKKSKYCRFVSQFSRLPESSGSIFTALVSSAKFDFKLPEVKEGLYSINTRSSHTFLKLLHSLLSKITILSGAGRLQFSFRGRDGQRMSSSHRRFLLHFTADSSREGAIKGSHKLGKPLYTPGPCRIWPLHPAAGDSPHLAAVEQLRHRFWGHEPEAIPQIIGTCVQPRNVPISYWQLFKPNVPS